MSMCREARKIKYIVLLKGQMSKPDDDPYEEYFTNLNDEPPRIKAGGKSRKYTKKSAKNRKSTKKRKMMSGGGNPGSRGRSSPKKSPKKSRKKFFVKTVKGKEPFCVDKQGRRVDTKEVHKGIKGKPPFCAVIRNRSPARTDKQFWARVKNLPPALQQNAYKNWLKGRTQKK